MPKTIQNNIYYETIGKGKPLVLLSGLGADHFYWAQVVKELRHLYQVILIDNRGAGQTGIVSEQCTTELMANDVVEVLDELGIESAFIVGHSMGGYIAQQMAIHHPGRVKKIILCSTRARMTALTRHQININISMMHADISRELIVRNSLLWLYSDVFYSNEGLIDKVVEFILLTPFEETRKNYLHQVEAVLNHDVSNELEKIACPTLIVGGDEDLLVPVAILNELTDGIPNAECVIVPGMAHMFPIEKPAEFSEVVRGWLE